MAIDVLMMREYIDRFMAHIEIRNPSWSEVGLPIRSLNNLDRNDLYLTPDENDPETYLAVGGGDGRYLVTGSMRNERFPTIVDPYKESAEKEPLLVGVQEGCYPANWIIDLEAALHAAKVFYESGTFALDRLTNPLRTSFGRGEAPAEPPRAGLGDRGSAGASLSLDGIVSGS